MRIVCDTNVLVAAIVFAGRPREVLSAVLARRVRGFLCPATEQEFRAVLLRRKFGFTGEQVEQVWEGLRESMEMVFPDRTPSVIPGDTADDAILACAWAARADCIVSGDRHLLRLGSYRHIDIVTPAKFLVRLA